ncbi:MAG: hypothetical protein U5L75_01650 [Candidatus Campbellbacteria bacterium]|nr:hypothetical protein [Candidatus Campbellbacteria bacterium]
MEIIFHLVLFLSSAVFLWFFAGLLIDATNTVARKLKRNSFTVAFFVLGFLTSIGELSIMINSVINGTPQIAAGNTIGSSFVILLFIIPVLAIVGRGIRLENALSMKQLAAALLVVVLPVLFILDGQVQVIEGVVGLLVYLMLIVLLQKPHRRWWWQKKPESATEIVEDVEEELHSEEKATKYDFARIVFGGIVIFLAGSVLVDETVYFSELLSIPSSIIGLLLLSISTNVPELIIAVRAVKKGNANVALGNYLGSAVANTVIFSFLALFTGTFAIFAGNGLSFTSVLMVVGLILFYLFSRSKNDISRKEGVVLASFYAVLILSHFINYFWI